MGRMDLPTQREVVDDWERSMGKLVETEERWRRIEEQRESRGWLAKKLDLAPSGKDLDKARDESREARREERRTRRLVAELAVGARPESWGALSGWPRFHLERTIGELLELDPAKIPAPVADELRGIRDSLHQGRIEAHRGDHALADSLALRLADALEEVVDPPTRRKIVHHLPGDLRPIPGADPSTLEPRDFFDPRTVAFGEDLFHLADDRLSVSVTVTPKGELRLHDIVARPQGRGLVSAGLEHLCRAADHYGLAVVGEIGPTAVPGRGEEAERKREDASRRLALWYGRFGFVVAPREGGRLDRAGIRREPPG